MIAAHTPVAADDGMWQGRPIPIPRSSKVATTQAVSNDGMPLGRHPIPIPRSSRAVTRQAVSDDGMPVGRRPIP